MDKINFWDLHIISPMSRQSKQIGTAVGKGHADWPSYQLTPLLSAFKDKSFVKNILAQIGPNLPLTPLLSNICK
jgi:hypothetical protein